MLLAVDTSTQTIAIALYDDPVVLASMQWTTANHHTVELTSAVELLMKKCALKTSDLTHLVAALGPGTFTGLRIGLAFIKGLALSLHIPVVGIPTFDYMAAAQPLVENPMAVVLPAGRKRLAVGWYAVKDDMWASNSAPEVLTPAELSERIDGPTLICGELTADERQTVGRKWKNAQLLPPALSMRNPALLAQIGWQRIQNGQTDDPAILAPIYLHVAGGVPD